jgi:hypothetical protein
MPRLLPLAAVPAVAALGLAALPATGTAATITPSAPCVSSLFEGGKLTYEPMVGKVVGCPPGGTFTISGRDGEASFFTGTYGPDGSADYAITSYGTKGIKPSAGQSLTLEVKEPINGVPTLTGEVGIKKTNIAIDFDITSPRNLAKSRRVKVSGTPFANQRLYGFLIKGTKVKKSSKSIRRVSLGKANACGYVNRKAAFFRSSRPSDGKYSLVVQAGTKFDSSKAGISRSFGVETRRVFR